MTLKELRDNLDLVYSKYGDGDVFIKDPDGGKLLFPEDMWAVVVGPVFRAVYIRTERREERKNGKAL